MEILETERQEVNLTCERLLAEGITVSNLGIGTAEIKFFLANREDLSRAYVPETIGRYSTKLLYMASLDL